MGEGISKEELAAFLESYKNNYSLFEKILASQAAIVECQDKISARLYNGLAKDIATNVEKNCLGCAEKTNKKLDDLDFTLNSLEEEGTVAFKLAKLEKETGVTKSFAEKAAWFIGIAAGLIVIVSAISTVVVNKHKVTKEEIRTILTELNKENK